MLLLFSAYAKFFIHEGQIEYCVIIVKEVRLFKDVNKANAEKMQVSI